MRRGIVIAAVVVVALIGIGVVLQGPDPGAPEVVAGDSARESAAGSAPPVNEQVRPNGNSGGQAAGVAADATGLSLASRYTIDPAQSEVYWRIYRAGAAARLGHNHVISMTEFSGAVSVDGDLASAEWELSFAVDALVIDDPEIRARYGEDFESVPSEDDKAGTRRNMMTDRVLNGEVFPEIRLTGTGLVGTPGQAQLPVAIELLGRTVEQTFPASIVASEDSLTVTGEYRLTHEDLGMEPFSAFGGIIAVGNEIDFTYRIHAIAGDR